jgi:hypothetical protein
MKKLSVLGVVVGAAGRVLLYLDPLVASPSTILIRR